MNDKLIKGITKDGYVRFFAVNSTNTMKTAAEIHKLSLINKIIFGRLINATLLMSADLKNKTDQISLVLETDGTINKAVTVAYYNGDIKGYIANPKKELPPDEKTGGFNIKKALGSGYIKIIKELGLKSPYIGIVELKYGEIGEDITYYFAQSEQIPTALSVGVLLGKEGKIMQSGGFMIQLMPDTPEEIALKIENSLKKLPNFTDLMDMGYSIEKIVTEIILKDFAIETITEKEIRYHCNCSKDKFSQGIKLLGKDELEKAIENNETLKAVCHFCNKEYQFPPTDLKKILTELSIIF